MLLKNKNAIIYGAAGNIGSAVSMAYAREGARVFLTDIKKPPLEWLAGQIQAAGGKAEIAVVNALDEEEMALHALDVKRIAGSIDISFNAIGICHERYKPVHTLSLHQFELPALSLIRSHFISSRVASVHMKRQGSGVVMMLTASDDCCLSYFKGGYMAAYKGLEAFSGELSSELGASGVRVVCLRCSNGSKNYCGGTNDEGFQLHEDVSGNRFITGKPYVETVDCTEIGSICAFMASEKCCTISGIVEISGVVMD
jgi:3-oxoacyl-[acyl-carrier protein] reductase